MSLILDKLQQYHNSDMYPFHMPGHKQNATEGPFADIFAIDITEIDEYDNLHEPEGILLEGMKRLASLYGSDKAYYLVNGSTCGLLAAISAATHKKDRILIARNCHKAVYNAIYLNQLDVEYVYPRIDDKTKIAMEISATQIRQKLEENPDIKAVLITSPTYEGVISNIQEIANIVHEYNIPLIVDEAHGAHLGFEKHYAGSSITEGADLVIQSAHKMLPAMTQTAILHSKGDLIDRNRLERFLRIYQTSSPSYVFMASIDYAMDIVEEQGTEYLGCLYDLRKELHHKLQGMSHLAVLFEQEMEERKQDPAKIVIWCKDQSICGKKLYDIYRNEYHLQPEMASESYVLFYASMMDTKEGFDRLIQASLDIDQILEKEVEKDGIKQTKRQMAAAYDRFAEIETKKSIYDAVEGALKEIDIREATGKIAAEYINLYPPGVPIIVPGEVYNSDIINQIMDAESKGLHVQGLLHGKVKVVT